MEVADKFGDYGLTGVIIVNRIEDALAIETFLLSCRVLGRGVEHAMLAHVGKLAVSRGLAFVRLAFAPTLKNEPALNFVRAVGVSHPSSNEPSGGMIVRIPAAVAASTLYRPGDATALNDAAPEGGSKKPLHSPASSRRAKSERYARIAFDLSTPEAVVRAVENRSPSRRTLADKAIAADSSGLRLDAHPDVAVTRIGCWLAGSFTINVR